MNQTFYQRVTRCLTPFIPFFLWLRERQGKEDKARLEERFGRTKIPRPTGVLLWLHGVSVGEVLILAGLQKALGMIYPGFSWLITSGTRTSAELLSEQIRKGDLKNTFHQYCPVDTPGAVESFLSHWCPDMAIFAESDLWPNLILASRARQIPMALINARLSQKTQGNWLRHRMFAREILTAFEVVLAADQPTKETLGQILGKPVAYTGNIKGARIPERPDLQKLKALRLACQGRCVWLAASTHAGEEEIILSAHKKIQAERPDALLILVPRHPERASSLRTQITESEFNVQLRQTEKRSGKKQKRMFQEKEDLLPKKENHVYLVNTLGELNVFYALSPVSLMGGSLQPEYKGHNPYEPAAFESVILSGRHVESFAHIYESLFLQKGAFCLEKEQNLDEQIARKVTEFWQEPNRRQSYTKTALRVIEKEKRALVLTIEALKPLLNRVSNREST